MWHHSCKCISRLLLVFIANLVFSCIFNTNISVRLESLFLSLSLTLMSSVSSVSAFSSLFTCPARCHICSSPPPSGYKYSALQPMTDSFYRSHRITSQWLMSSYRSHCHESHWSLWACRNSSVTLSGLFNVFSMPLIGLSHSGNMYMSSELFIMLAKPIT